MPDPVYTLRRAYRITTQLGPAADANQAALASLAVTMSPAEEDVYDVEKFSHVFDPIRFQTWLAWALNPTIQTADGLRFVVRDPTGAGRVLRQAATVAPAPVTTTPLLVPYLGNLLPIPPSGDVVLGARADGGTSPAAVDTATTSAPAGVPEGELRRAIHALAPELQWKAALASIFGVLGALRALNLSLYAILPYRQLAERLWGYFPYESENYFVGFLGRAVQEWSAPAYGRTGEWRTRIAQAHNERTGTSRWSGPEVMFGAPGLFNPDVGCTNISLSGTASCGRPTGEAHTVWIHPLNLIRGGLLTWSPSLDPLAVMDQLTVGTRQTGWWSGGWQDVYWYVYTPGVGRHRLFAMPPVGWYWGMFFDPQPEFGMRSLVQWLRTTTPDEILRTVRRDNTRRNMQVAEAYGVADVLSIVGAGQITAQASAESEQRNRQVLGALLGGATAAATAVNPIAGLVVGAVSLTTQFVMTLAGRNDAANRRIDVFGQMCPTFVQFNLWESQTTYEAEQQRQGGWPAVPDLSIYMGAVLDPVTKAQAQQILAQTASGVTMQTTPPPAPPLAPSPPSRSGVSFGTVAGILGGVALLGTGGVLGWRWMRSRKADEERPQEPGR